MSGGTYDHQEMNKNNLTDQKKQQLFDDKAIVFPF